MPTFNEANQARLALKMKLSNYAWYNSSRVYSTNDGFGVIVAVYHVDNQVRKLIAPVFNGISIKTEVDNK
jgi:hypothetical protein